MSSTFDYFEKYASLLDEGDLLDLFDIIKSDAQSLSEAARRCRIERKTIYDMMNEGKEVKRQTKERILRAALKSDLEKTIGLLLTKTMKESKEILLNHLSLIYQHAIRARDLSEFNRAAARFEEILDKNAGLVAGSMQEEVSSMVGELADKSTRLGGVYSCPKLRLMGVDTLAVTIPALVRDLMMVPGAEPTTLANKYRMDPSVVLSTSQVLSTSRVERHETETSMLPGSRPQLDWSPIEEDLLQRPTSNLGGLSLH
jgi:predicted DNA-binding protein YlxM (UPF0122 family)